MASELGAIGGSDSDAGEDFSWKVFVVEKYWFHQKSPSTGETEFKKVYGRQEVPSKPTILNLVKKFPDPGTIHELIGPPIPPIRIPAISICGVS